jgi:hypothetical protein
MAGETFGSLRRGEARIDAALAELDGIASASSRLFAMEARALAGAVVGAHEVDDELGHGLTSGVLAAHVAGTLTVRQGTAQFLLDRARHLVWQLPATWQALDEGWLRIPQALVLMEETAGLDPARCAQVEAEVLAWIGDRTTGEVRRRVRRILKRLADQAEEARARRRAVAGRAVAGSELPDGMAGVWATFPAGAQRLFLTALRALADRAKTDGDRRTAAQREADVLAALPSMVLDALTGAYGPEVQQAIAAQGFRPGGQAGLLNAVLLMPAASALGQSDEPGELVGYGPVTAEHGRALLATATIRTATVDSAGRIVALSDNSYRPDGEVLAALVGLTAETAEASETAGILTDGAPDDPGELGGHGRAEPGWVGWLHAQLDRPHPPPGDEPQYRPSAGLRRLVALRDPHCIGIGCSTPAGRCDTEHRLPYPHGPTGPGNLAPVSRRCHRIKQTGWTYRRTRDGTTVWTAPNRRVYRRPAVTWTVPPVTRPAAARAA